jgi:hypothetical protein
MRGFGEELCAASRRPKLFCLGTLTSLHDSLSPYQTAAARPAKSAAHSAALRAKAVSAVSAWRRARHSAAASFAPRASSA